MNTFDLQFTLTDDLITKPRFPRKLFATDPSLRGIRIVLGRPETVDDEATRDLSQFSWSDEVVPTVIIPERVINLRDSPSAAERNWTR